MTNQNTPPAPGRADGLVPYKLPVRAVNPGGAKIRIEDADGNTFAVVYYAGDDYGKQIKDTLAVARAEAIVAAINRPAPAIVAEVGDTAKRVKIPADKFEIRWSGDPDVEVVLASDYDAALRTLAEVRRDHEAASDFIRGCIEAVGYKDQPPPGFVIDTESMLALVVGTIEQFKHEASKAEAQRDAATQRAEQAEALLANVHAQTAHNGTITNSLRDAIDAALPAPATNATGSSHDLPYDK